MASAAPQLPLFYKNLVPLSSNAHGNYKARRANNATYVAQAHAIPLTIDEFVIAQRHYPIVFSVGDTPVPLALFGLNEGVNTYMDEQGQLLENTYLPAYVRRYPFMLARTRPDADELSLCFDPTADVVGEFEDGDPLFEDGQASQATQSILKFCEEFEVGAQRTQAFMKELQEAELLMPGEASIKLAGQEQPFVYRGFQMVSEEKLQDMRGDQLRKINQNGILQLVMAHLFSLTLIPELFARQARQGKGPQLAFTPEPIDA